jgi:ferredoxin/flavodoxin
MLFYFTATGNSLDAARTIADTTGDRMIDLGLAYKMERFEFHVEQGEDLGFVFPVYGWSAPGIVDDFLRKARFVAGNGKSFVPGYSYCVITCGAFVGKTADFFATMLEKYQSIRLDASYSVKCVGNCVYLYDMPSEEKQESVQKAAHLHTKEIAYLIDGKRMVHQETRNPFGSLMSMVTCREEKPRSVESFHVDKETCTGCGLCAQICPTSTIAMEDGYPTWSGGNCTQCLACLHRCPSAASQYGTKTAKRGRYTNPALAQKQMIDGAGIDASVPDPQ